MLTIKIHTDNAAFEEPYCGSELARLLQIAARKVEVRVDKSDKFDDVLIDVNGNKVGTIVFRP